MPKNGDKILVMKANWLSMILAGHKTMEIRGTAFRAGKYYLGHKGLIHGVVQLGAPACIESDKRWRELAHQHKMARATRPYKKTFGLGILKMKPTCKYSYHHPRGAIAIVRYRNS